MSRQQSKRFRRIEQDIRFSSSLTAPQAPKPRRQLYIYRPLDDPDTLRSLTEPLRALRDIDPSIQRRQGRLALTLLYPGEVRRIAALSPYKDQISMMRINQELATMSAGVFRAPVTAEVKGLEQFGAHIGFNLRYPEYSDERAFLLAAIGGLMNVKSSNYTFNEKPHLTIAHGRLPNGPNATYLAPAAVTLSPAQLSLRN